MNVIYVGGGLANKMFHCAFAKALEVEGRDVFIDDESFISEFAHDKVLMCSIFPNWNLRRMPKGIYKYGGKKGFIAKIMRRLSWVTGEKYSINHSYFYDKHFVDNLPLNAYIIAPFQNENYFIAAEKEIRELYNFFPFTDLQNVRLQKEMNFCQSIAIHVRKGDGYETWDIFKETCPVTYYRNAVDYINQHVRNAVFYVFTDSPMWVKKNLSFINYVLVDWNPNIGFGNHWDMQLMACAKHNIIANSTYSWWGAWLNSNPQKIVIAPKTWFNPKIERTPYIVPERWIRL